MKNYDENELMAEVMDALQCKTLKLEFCSKLEELKESKAFKVIKSLYKNKSKENQLCGVVLNYAVTQRRSCFMLSTTSIRDMAEDDPNLTDFKMNISLACRAIKKLKAGLIEELHSPIKSAAGNSKRPGLYRIKPELLRDATGASEADEMEIIKEYERSYLENDEKASA